MELQVIESGPGGAHENMEADRRIIATLRENPDRAVLRWYGWSPPAFSLGYGQNPEALFRRESLESRSVVWVKRPTGGSLLHHGGDLSYSLTLPRENPWGVRDSRGLYRFVGDVWIRGFRELGMSLSLPDSVPSARSLAPEERSLCLAAHSEGDLLLEGKKIGGCAQRRLRNVWHQQGFFLLRPVPVPDCLLSPVSNSIAVRLSSDLRTLGYDLSEARIVPALTREMRVAIEASAS